MKRFEEELLGCRLQFEFPVCKLLDLIETAEQASHTGQPSAVVILANWATQHTRQDMVERRRWKRELTQRLYRAGLDRSQILQLYRLLDWLLRLPEPLERDRRCGDLSPAVESKVRALSPSELETLAEALLDFSGLSDLERWLQRS
jgi:hypothetical protein